MTAPAEMRVAALHAVLLVISHRAPDDFRERREAHLAKIAKGAARVEQDARRVVRPERADLGLGVFVELHRADDLVVKTLDRDIMARREMVGAAAGPVRRPED